VKVLSKDIRRELIKSKDQTMRDNTKELIVRNMIASAMQQSASTLDPWSTCPKARTVQTNLRPWITAVLLMQTSSAMDMRLIFNLGKIRETLSKDH